MQVIINVAFRASVARDGRILFLLMCASAWTQNVGASTLTYNLGYRAEYSENVRRATNEQAWESDVISMLSAGVSYLENTTTFNARVNVNAAYYDYYYGTFDNETNLALDAYGEFFFVPQVVSWVAADGFRKVQIDPRQPDIPTNRQNSNVFLTGPNVYVRLGPIDSVTLEARYGRAGVERADIDNERDSLAARWEHRMSTWSTLSFNYEYFNVDYENSLANSDFQRHNFFLRTNIHSARNDYMFDLGKTRIDLERGDPISNLLLRMAVTRQMSSVSNLSVLYVREYSDTGTQLLPAEASSQPTPGGIVQPLGTDVVSRELFYSEQTELSHAWRGNTFPWTARMFSRNLSYELSATDNREEKGLIVDVQYLYSNSLTFLLSSSYILTTFSEPIREDRDAVTGVGFMYRLSRSLTAGLDLRRYARSSPIPSQEYTDNRIALTITYGNILRHVR